MDLYDIAIAKKLAGGGGSSTTVEALSVTENGTYTAPTGKAYSPVTVNVSGGSSDFTTATVTFICTENYYTISSGYFIQNGNAIIPTAQTAIRVTSNNNVELEIPLYNGQVALPLMCFLGTDTYVLPTVTGDITLNMGSLSFDITGDGSISFKGEEGQA